LKPSRTVLGPELLVAGIRFTIARNSVHSQVTAIREGKQPHAGDFDPIAHRTRLRKGAQNRASRND
jgi:hypothetical protein